MVETKTIDIEHAIETVRQFAHPFESRAVPTLAYFELKDGKLQIHARSKLEKTLAFTKDCILRPFFPKKQKKAVNQTVQASLDLLKIYSQAVSQIQNQTLARELLRTAEQYNAMVRKVKNQAPTFSQKVKKFFFSLAGWSLADELIETEIHIPERTGTTHKLTGLLQNVQKLGERARAEPKKEELDAFRLKAISLLGRYEDSFELVHNYPIESSLQEEGLGYGMTVLQLRQRIVDFPGEEVVITGSFQRDSFHAELCFPVPGSFQINYTASQSGFPHPVQYIGFSLHEKWLPTFMLHPKKATKLHRLIEKKQYVSHELLPEGVLNRRAKNLLSYRRQAFQNNPCLKQLLEQVMTAIVIAAKLDPEDSISSFFAQNATYDEIGNVHEEIVQIAICKPLEILQHEWLFNNNESIGSIDFCKKLVEAIIEKEYPFPSYQKLIAQALSQAVPALYLMQLSEHLKIVPPKLSDFDAMLLTSLFRQALTFSYELELVDGLPKNYLEQLFEEEKALFGRLQLPNERTTKAQALVEEFVSYYTFVKLY